MGANWFRMTAYGKTLSDAYNNAIEEAIHESGNDAYNGTISTTGHCEDLTDQFKRSKKGFDDYVKLQQDKLNKRECAGICISDPIKNTNKIKTIVEHVVTPGTKQWVLKYEVENHFEDRVIGSCMTKGDAVKMARAYTEKNQHTTKIIIRKVLIKSSSVVANVTYKKSTTERTGKYILFGWAAE